MAMLALAIYLLHDMIIKKTFNYNTSSQKVQKTPNHGKVKFKTENGIGNGGGPSIHDT